MKFKETKSAKLLEGKGFYIVLAGCLVAIGVAAWTAWAGLSAPDTAQLPESSSDISSSVASDPVQQETKDEPYEETPSKTDTSSQAEPNDPGPIVADNFVYPLSGNILKPYSDKTLVFSKTFSDMRLHMGLDIEAERGTAVNSCGNGIVTAITEDSMLGKYVEIDHGNGIVARYCGLSDKVSVAEGNIVSAGTKLGLLDGSPCEKEDASHLHIEFFKDEYPVNPQVIIEG